MISFVPSALLLGYLTRWYNNECRVNIQISCGWKRKLRGFWQWEKLLRGKIFWAKDHFRGRPNGKKSHIYTILLTTYLRFEEIYGNRVVIITFPWSIFITLFPVFHRRVCTWMGKETLVVWKLNGRWVIDTGVLFHIIYQGVGLIYTARTVV